MEEARRFQLVAGADAVAEAIDRFEGDQIAAVDGIAVENGIELGDDGLDAGGSE